MGQTIAQKIIARAAGLDAVETGSFVTVTPDYSVGHEMFWGLHQRNMKEIGVERFPKPDKVILVIDHTTHANMDSPYVQLHSDLRAFVRETGFKNFYDVGRGGLRHLVMVENGYARPGLFIFSDEGNIASIGAFGALNMHISWEVLVPMICDENWVLVPETVRINLVGELPFGVLIRDLVQAINRDYSGTDKLLQKCVEIDGPGLAALSLDNRQALLAGLYQSGIDTGIMPVDEKALAYVEERAKGRPFQVFESDPDAEFAFDATYDLSELEPFVTVPPEQQNVVPVSEVAGIRVDQASIGSCASNRLDDIRDAARVLRGRRIADHVTMYVSPGSQEVYADAAAEGLLEILSRAGASVLTPGCNTCFGYVGALSAGQTSISTQQQNYPGRSGSMEADIYLGSPYVVAASAVAGEIVDPRSMLSSTDGTD